MIEIEAAAFARKIIAGELNNAQLLDVREQREWNIYRLDDAILMPLRTLPDQVLQLDRQKVTYVYCAHGIRSRYAVSFLQEIGFTQPIHVNDGLAVVLHYIERECGKSLS